MRHRRGAQRLARAVVGRAWLGGLRGRVAPVPSALRPRRGTAARHGRPHAHARCGSGHRHGTLGNPQQPQRQTEPRLHRGQSRRGRQHRFLWRFGDGEPAHAGAVLLHRATRLSAQCRRPGKRWQLRRDDVQRVELRRLGLGAGPVVFAVAKEPHAAQARACVLHGRRQRPLRPQGRHWRRDRAHGGGRRDSGWQPAPHAGVEARARAYACDVPRGGRVATVRQRTAAHSDCRWSGPERRPAAHPRPDVASISRAGAALETRGGSGWWRVPHDAAAQ